MKNSYIIKIGGILAIISFLFFPVAGCGGMTMNGIDVMKMSEISIAVKIFAIVAMLCAVAIIFMQDKISVFFSAIGGFVSLIIAYFIAKGKMSSGHDFGMSDAIELKSGSYFSMLGFIISGVISRIEKEIFTNQLSEKILPNTEENKTVHQTNIPPTDLKNEKTIVKELHEKGVLTAEEYESKIKEINKREIETTIDNKVNAETKPLIDKIIELKNSGLLTEEEFKAKHSEIIEKQKIKIEENNKIIEEWNNNRPKVSDISCDILDSLSEPNKHRLEKCLEAMQPLDVIAFHDTKVKIIDADRWRRINEQGTTDDFKVIYKRST